MNDLEKIKKVAEKASYLEKNKEIGLAKEFINLDDNINKIFVDLDDKINTTTGKIKSFIEEIPQPKEPLSEIKISNFPAVQKVEITNFKEKKEKETKPIINVKAPIVNVKAPIVNVDTSKIETKLDDVSKTLNDIYLKPENNEIEKVTLVDKDGKPIDLPINYRNGSNFKYLRDKNGENINPATSDNQEAVIETNIHTGVQELRVVSKGHVCTDNTTDIPLGISGVFTGNWQDTLDYSEVIVSVFSDKDSATNGLAVYWSANGVDIHGDDFFTITGGIGKTFSFPCQNRYVKVVYTNGTVAQTSFHLETLLKRFASKGSSHRIQDNIKADDDAILTKSVLTGQGDDGVFRNAKVSVGNRLQTVSQPYTYAVSEGDLLNHYPLLKFGTRTTILAGVQSNIWEGNTALYQYMTTAQQLKISSSSSQDGVGGTGALTLKIYGLDENFLEIDETITMNGTSVVTTTKSYIRIFRAYVVTCGTSYTNVGKITITNNAGTVEQAVINANDGQTLMALWTVPADKTSFLLKGTLSSDTNKGARVSLFVRQLDGGTLYPWQIKYRSYIFGGENAFNFSIPFKIGPKTDIEVRVTTPGSAGTTSAGATFEMWYKNL